MEFREFLAKQEEVYNRFRDTSKIKSLGTQPNIPESQSGYLMVFRHPLEMALEIEKFSRRIATHVPLMVYDSITIHTTISDYGIVSGSFAPDKTILEKLSKVAQKISKTPPTISYTEWLYNQNTLFVAGNSNELFLQIAEQAKAKAEREGIQLRLPWGAHITAARFKESKTPKDLEEFFKLMQEAPLIGNSKSKFLDVGYFDFSPRGFNITIHDRFNLQT